MQKILSLLCAATALCAAPAPAQKPKLILAVVVDQFRYDYLNRFRTDYHGGFAQLLEKGAFFTNAHHEHFPTVTSIGHSTFMSGATPSLSGIVANEWFDRAAGKKVTSVEDESVQLLGGAGKGSSPHRMLVSTLGDELKMAGKGQKVIGISIKDRSAILPAGHMADGAYWLDLESGNFVSSTFYFKQLPAWASDFNQLRPATKYLGMEWMAIDDPHRSYHKLSTTPGKKYYTELEHTPFGNDLIEMVAERAIEAEQLGRHPGTDLLTISFSSNDYVGHELGPDAAEVRDISIRTDRLLEKLFKYIDSQVGPGNTLVVLTADHGIAPLPEVSHARRMPGGRIPEKVVFDVIEKRLSGQFGAGKWVAGNSGPAVYLNYDLMREKKLDSAAVQMAAADAVRAVPHVFRVYTRDQLLAGQVLEDRVSRRVRNGFYHSRSADIFPIPEAYWIFNDKPEKKQASHGTPFNFDTHVPLLFMGPGIKPGKYYTAVAINDIAPTLAALLDLEFPSGSVGRVLDEMFGDRR